MAAEATVLRLEPGKDFVVTPFVENICQRCLAYLKAGYPVHLSGPAGTGKTLSPCIWQEFWVGL